MTIDEQTLREAAEAATPGQWAHGHGPWADRVTTANRSVNVGSPTFVARDIQWVADARYIAAANPQVVLALLDDLAEVRAFKEKYHEQWMLYAETVKRVEAALEATHRHGEWKTRQAIREALAYEDEAS